MELALWTAVPPDLPEIAGFYSQLAGVLAGFSFAAIVALVTTRGARPHHRAVRRLGRITVQRRTDIPVRRSVVPLTGAFIALVASSLNYAVVTGEVLGSARVAALQTVAGMGFSVAGMTMLYSILVLLADLQTEAGEAAVGLLRGVTVLVVPALLVLLMWGGVRDHLGHRYGPDVGFKPPDWAAVALLALTVTLSVVFRLTSFHRPNDQSRSARMIALAAAWLAFASLVAAAGLITLTRPESTVRDEVPVVAMMLVGAFCIATAYSASRYGPAAGPPPGPSRRQLRPAATASRPAGPDGSDGSDGRGETIGVLQPLDRPTLVRRTVEIFPQGYLMNISIIQGVALSVVIVETVNFLKSAPGGSVLPTVVQSALTLAGLVIVSYQYLWFTTIMRWTPTFRDTAIPVVLGVTEIVPALLLGRHTAWWVATGAFGAVGSLAFMNTVSRLRRRMFPGYDGAYEAVRRLLRRLAAISAAAAILILSIAALVDRYPQHTDELSTVGACLVIVGLVPLMIGMTEAVLNRVYAEFGIGRRPPLFDQLRRGTARGIHGPNAGVPAQDGTAGSLRPDAPTVDRPAQSEARP